MTRAPARARQEKGFFSFSSFSFPFLILFGTSGPELRAEGGKGVVDGFWKGGGGPVKREEIDDVCLFSQSHHRDGFNVVCTLTKRAGKYTEKDVNAKQITWRYRTISKLVFVYFYCILSAVI